jgi:ASC-1-like (ASCH) protein
MRLRSEPFNKIKNGLKVVELRLYDEKRREIQIGDDILFTLFGAEETLRCTVVDLYRFKDFEELYSILSYRALGYWGEEIAAASPRDMEQYYATEDIEKYGVVGIRIKLI